MPMKNNIPITKIEEYLDGQMNEEEKQKFESEISNNKEIKDQVTFIQDLKKIASHDGRETLKNKIKNAENKHANNIESNSRKKRIRKFRAISAAASITILVSLSIALYLTQNKNEQLYDEFFLAPENTFISYAKGGAESEQIQLLTRAAKYYDRKEFENAAKIFNKHIELTPELSSYIFLSAMSNMAVNNTKKAMQQLEYIKKTGLDNLPAEYFIGLIYLKNGNTEKAFAQLKNVADRKGAYSQKATAIIKKLE